MVFILIKVRNICLVTRFASKKYADNNKNNFDVSLQAITLAIVTKYSVCSIAGITYMDPLNFKPLPDKQDPNPCNPLYWYPQAVPDYCFKTPNYEAPARPPPTTAAPLPVPVPVPVPLPLPIPLPYPPISYPMPYPAPYPPMLPPAPAPPPMPPVPSPYGIPVPPNPLLPMPGVPFPPLPPYPAPPMSRQAGMVPGIPGLVSEDGGINILPFSDVFTDMVEEKKNKLIRKRYKQLVKDYEDYPWGRRRRHKKRRRKKTYHDFLSE